MIAFWLSALTSKELNDIVNEGIKISEESCAQDKTIKKAHFERFRGWLNKYFSIKALSKEIAGIWNKKGNDAQRKQIEETFEEYIKYYFASPNYLKYLCDYSFEPDKTVIRGKNSVVTSFKHKKENKRIRVTWGIDSNGKIKEIDVDGIKLIFQQKKMALGFKNKPDEYLSRMKTIKEKNEQRMG